MTNEQNDETILPINEQQRDISYNEISRTLETLGEQLSRLADFAEMVGEPKPDQMKDLQRNTIRCVHAFADATLQIARHRRRRTRLAASQRDKSETDTLAKIRHNQTHPSVSEMYGHFHNTVDPAR